MAAQLKRHGETWVVESRTRSVVPLGRIQAERAPKLKSSHVCLSTETGEWRTVADTVSGVSYADENLQSLARFEDCAGVEACRIAHMAAVEPIVAFDMVQALLGRSSVARRGKHKGCDRLATRDWYIDIGGIHAAASSNADYACSEAPRALPESEGSLGEGNFRCDCRSSVCCYDRYPGRGACSLRGITGH